MNNAEFPSVTVGGLPITVTTRADAGAFLIGEAIDRRGLEVPPYFATSANANVLSQCAKNALVRDTYLSSDAIHADGMSVVFASRLMGSTTLPERVATTDLFHDVAKAAEQRGASFYMLGAKQAALHKALANVSNTYPGLNMVGARNGYFTEEDEDALVAEINAARPDVLWVGIGVPHAQFFCVRNRARLTGVGVIKTCGGLFDFLAGDVARAPNWMQAAGLEWLFRMMQNPRRLIGRNITTNLHAIYLFMMRTQ